MKKAKIAISIICATALAFAVSSCNEEALNLKDSEKLSDQAIWGSETSADLYITAAYKTITDVSQVSNSRSQFFDSFSDIMKSTSWDQYNHGYNKALLQASAFTTGSAGALDCWSAAYDRIRRANVLLDEITRYGSKYGEDWCNIRRAEVRLCRAFSYYRLIRVYGGIVLRTDTSGTSGGVDDGAYPADVNRARLSEADSWNYVITELQWAAQYLPETWSGTWTGRATKASAYGFLSRMALHAKEWQIAVDAANEVKTLGGALAPDYARVFKVDQSDPKQDNSHEILFALYYLKGSVVHSYDAYNRPFGDKAVYTTDVYAEHVPTAELADLYEFSDGTDFDWTTYSGTHSNPYTDREPRFHATIMYNGAAWEGRSIQTFDGGSDAFQAFTQSSATFGHTCTGYYLRKYLQEGYNGFMTDKSYQYDAVLRYAEVLLNKAEAYAELDYPQNQANALAALNEVRDRVGLPAKTNADAPDKDSFMALLRKERCVELAGEGLRYWDLRRWKLAESTINGKNAHGVKVTDNGGGNYTYERVAVDGGTPRIFLESYYYLSLPTQELANNKLAENNLYW